MSLPVFLSTFIGRKTELGEIKSLIRERSVRLLTLTGPGGCGKTRLAREILSDLEDTFEDGIVWVDLVGLSTEDALLVETAAALDVRPSPGQTLSAALTAALRQRETLLVLDNCEHLVDASAQLVDRLLRACPELHVLVTSRQRLGVDGEQRWQVPPLSYPADDPPAMNSPGEYDAIQLFLARARLVHPGFDLDSQTLPALVQITRLLEGMPLAIELAAARVSELDIPELAKRLDDQLSLLHGKVHTPVSHHHSMSETIRWSFDLLSAEEKVLFCRLGVFRSGFTLDAAEAVCSGEPLAAERVLDLLGKLVDKSLVLRESTGQTASHYRLLESIRQYASYKLGVLEEARDVHDRHLAYFFQSVLEAEPQLLGSSQKAMTEALEEEYENVQAALSWSVRRARLENGFSQQTARMADGLYWFWNYSGRHEEAKGWYATIIDLPGLDRRSSLYAHIQHRLATFVWLLGNYPEAQGILQDCLETASQAGDSHMLGHAKLMLGIMALHQGRTGQAEQLLRESEGLFSELHVRERLIAYTNLGGLHRAMGDLDAARHYAEKAVLNARVVQDLWGLGLSLSGLGEVLFLQGEVERSFQLMEEALELIQSSGQHWLQAEALWRIADMLRRRGELARAVARFEQCYDLAQVSGAVEWQLSALNSLGFLALRRGDQRQAAGHFSELLRMTGGQRYEHILVHAFLGVMRLALASGQVRLAGTLWEMYTGLKTAHGLPSNEEESSLHELLQPHIPARAFAGKASLAEATGLAMEITGGVERRIIILSSEFRLRLLGLGPAEVYMDGRLLGAPDWTFAKPKELLYYLVSHRPQTKEQIGLAFWPDASPAQLRVSLRATLYHLRRALEERSWILYEDGYYRFNTSLAYWFDVEAFESCLQAAGKQTTPENEQAIEKLEEAVSLYRGEYLSDLAVSEWATQRREELHGNYLNGLQRLGDLLAGTGSYDRAIAIYSKLLALDNLQEPAHRALMRCYAFNGDRVLALRQYKTLVEVLRDELGIAPSQETTALYRSLQGDGH